MHVFGADAEPAPTVCQPSGQNPIFSREMASDLLMDLSDICFVERLVCRMF